MRTFMIEARFEGVPERHKKQMTDLLTDLGKLVCEHGGGCTLKVGVNEPSPDAPKRYADMTKAQKLEVELAQIGYGQPIPEQVAAVAAAWAYSASERADFEIAEVNAVEQKNGGDGMSAEDEEAKREFWRGRLFGPVFCEHRGAWEICDNYEKCRILFYYPVRDKWTYMVPYADESDDMGFEEALAMARNVWGVGA